MKKAGEMMMRMLAVCALITAVSCATGSVEDQTAPEQAPAPATTPDVSQPAQPVNHTHPADAAIPLGKLAVAAAASWTDPIASLASIDIANGYTAKQALVTTDGSDVALRSFFGHVFVINKFGADTIEVIDPKGFGVVADYSVGKGSNPQDIWLVSEEKAYITRFDSQNDVDLKDDIIIVNPLDGSRLGSIDLKPYTTDDGDRLARATQMVAVGDKLFVCIEDLPTNLLDPANQSGKVAVIDTTKDVVETVIELSGRNPADITYSPLTKLIYVSESGVFKNFTTDVNDGFGGIEVIDSETLQSRGIVVDDALFGAYPSEIRLASATLGFVIVGGAKVASFNPATYEVINKAVYTTTGFYVPDFSLDESGNLYVTERSDTTPGIVILTGDGSVVAGPIAIGAPPSSVTFVDVGD